MASPQRSAQVTLVAALAGAPLVVTFALGFVLVPDETATWGPWPAVVGAIGVGGVVLAEVVGYRVPALAPDTPAEGSETATLQRWQTASILRFALVEAPFMVTIALSFVVTTPQPILLVAASAVIALLGILLHCWPWSRPVEKTAAALERDGGRTTLREDLGAVRTI